MKKTLGIIAVIAVMAMGMTGCGTSTTEKADDGLKELKIVKEVSYNYYPPAINVENTEYHFEVTPREFHYEENNYYSSETVETVETTETVSYTVYENTAQTTVVEETLEVTKNDVLPESTIESPSEETEVTEEIKGEDVQIALVDQTEVTEEIKDNVNEIQNKLDELENLESEEPTIEIEDEELVSISLDE